MSEKRTIRLKPSNYQPNKAELEEETRFDVPGNSLQERMDALAEAVMQPAEIEHEAAD